MKLVSSASPRQGQPRDLTEPKDRQVGRHPRESEECRRLYPDATADRGIRNLIEALRLGWASEDGDSVAELIDEMRTLSRDFDAIWSERKVARLGIIPGRVRPGPSSRPLSVEYSRFYVPTMPGYAIAALIRASSEDAAILRSHVDRMA